MALFVVVKWSTFSPSTLTIRVRIPLKPTVFSVKFVFEKKENKQKEAGVGPFLITISEGIEQRSNAQKRPKMVS